MIIILIYISSVTVTVSRQTFIFKKIYHCCQYYQYFNKKKTFKEKNICHQLAYETCHIFVRKLSIYDMCFCFIRIPGIRVLLRSLLALLLINNTAWSNIQRICFAIIILKWVQQHFYLNIIAVFWSIGWIIHFGK